MKTLLQELIERLEKEAKATKNSAIEIGILRSCKIATELLEKEREIAQEYAKQSKQEEDNELRKAAEEWNKYKSFLQEKYPVEEGEEWQFTCEHHQKIDEILNSKKH